MRKKGFALIAMIVLIVVIGLIVASSVSFILNSSRQNVFEAYKHLAYEAAYAGMMDAAYQALQNGTYTSAEAQLNGNQWYKYSFNSGGSSAGAANLYTDASASTQPINTQITGWTIINNSTEAGTIVSMQISWISPANNLLAVQLNGASVWSGTATTGTTVDITDTSVPASSTVSSNMLTFDGNMSNVSVYITFNFANGTALTRRIWRAQSAILPDGGPWYPTNLHSWWKMYENAGATVNDIINPNGANPPNNGTMAAGTSWTANGKFGPGVAFNGTNTAYIDHGNSSSLAADAFSVSCWIYLNSLPGADVSYGIVNRGNNAAGAPNDLTRGYEIYVNRNNDAVVANRNKIIFAVGPNGTSNKAVSTNIPSTSTWIHVVGSYDGTNARLYIDSVLNATVASSYSKNGTFYMGTRNGRSNTYLNGRIDEASYFTRAISATEISAINSPNTGESTAATIITSTGKFVDNSSNVLMRQTIVATFDVSGSSMNITNYDETTGHITP